MNTRRPLVEIGFDESAIPRKSNDNWFEVNYRGPVEGISTYKDGEIVFSTPEVSNKNLFSRGYRICLALAGINEITRQRVLAHVCPGGYYTSTAKRFSTTYMREHQQGIDENLKRWRDECGITNDNMGMAGSCIFPTSKEEGSLAYLETVKWMGDRLATILPGDPQILGLPSKGYPNEQHIAVSDKVLIIRQLGFTPTNIPKKNIPRNEIGPVISAMMKS